MGMTWKSLDLLRQNLGDVGEGVASYIKGRQEDTRREEQAAAMKQFLGSDAGKGIDPGLAQLAFSGHGFNAFPALAAVQGYRKSIAPQQHIVGGQDTGYKAIPQDVFTGEFGEPKDILKGKEKPATSALGSGNLDVTDLHFIAANDPDPAKRQLARNTLDSIKAQQVDVAEAGAGIREGVTKRSEDRARTEKAALDYGNQMEAQQKIVNELNAQLQSMAGKPFVYVNGKKVTAVELQSKIDAAKNAWEQARQQLNAIKHKEGTHIEKGTGVAKPITPGMDLSANDQGWQKHPAGFDFRMLG